MSTAAIAPDSPQQQRLEQLTVEYPGEQFYAERGQGKSIIAARQRVLASDDTDKITRPLYSFLTLKGGFIAHYDRGGFIAHYGETTDLISAFLYGETTGFRGIAAHRVAAVYSDGLTDHDVWRALHGLAQEHVRRLANARADRDRERDLSALRDLAERYGATVTFDHAHAA